MLRLLAATFCCTALRGQAPPSLPAAPAPTAETLAAATPLPLSIDDAIARGLARNLQIELSAQNERMVQGEVLTVGNALLPNLSATGNITARELNLAAMGFKPQTLSSFGITSFNPIIKVNTAAAQITISQQLFNVPAYYLYRAAQKATGAASFATLNVRGGITLQVATYYLRALADDAQMANARALLKADQVVLDQAAASHDAGVGTNLDVLRARVQLQQQQQVLINDENAFAKDKIALNRLIGLSAGQELTLTDHVPFEELTMLPLPEARDLAYTRRKDLLQLQAELEVAERSQKAVRYEYAPTVAVGGYYGVIGVIGGLYHGNFVAQGGIVLPVFREAEFRGEREVAAAQTTGLHQQIASLRDTIDGQLRDSMLDVESSRDLVRVARSNVALAGQVVSDAIDRFRAGVNDNLPVVQAQATLAGAQTRLVQTLYQYNTAKLQLARNTGVVETRYRDYLGR